MTKKLLIPLIMTAVLSVQTQATDIFNGSTDSVYKATTDNANMALTNPSSGTYTLTNNSASTQGGYLFGNFAATALADGESITLEFTISAIPDISPLHFSLSGVRGGVLNTSDVGFQEFSRSYAGYYQNQNLANIGMDVQAFNNGPATNATEDRQILSGGVDTSMDDGDVTLTGVDRFDAGRTANITMSMVRVGNAFRVDYTLEVVGGTGVQSFSSALFTPSDPYFGTGDAFTTFAIGYKGGVLADSFDPAEAMTISNITVTTSTGSPDPIVPVGVAIAISGSDVQLTFDSVDGQSYQLLVSTDNMATWEPVIGASATGDGNPLTLTDTGAAPTSGNKVFYKVETN